MTSCYPSSVKSTSRRATAALRRKIEASLPTAVGKQDGAGLPAALFHDSSSARVGAVWQTSPMPITSAEQQTSSVTHSAVARRYEQPKQERSKRNRNVIAGPPSPELRAGSDTKLQPHLSSPPHPPPAPPPSTQQSTACQQLCSPSPVEITQRTSMTAQPFISASAQVNTVSTSSVYTDPFDVLSIPDTQLTTVLLRKMMLAFRDSIQLRLDNALAVIKDSISVVELRVQDAEEKISEIVREYNVFVDSHLQLKEEVTHLKETLATVDDRSRGHNLKLRGVPESVPVSDLPAYTQGFMKELLPVSDHNDIIIDWARRLPRPAHLPPSTPRDALVRIRHMHIKSAFLAATRRHKAPSAQYASVSVFPDLSAATLQTRRSFAPVTTTLRDKGISYKWGNSSCLIITKGTDSFTIRDVDDGLQLLQTWNLPYLSQNLAETLPSPL